MKKVQELLAYQLKVVSISNEVRCKSWKARAQRYHKSVCILGSMAIHENQKLKLVRHFGYRFNQKTHLMNFKHASQSRPTLVVEGVHQPGKMRSVML